MLGLTIGLSGLDLLEEGLEPTERGGVTANPEELYALEGAEGTLLLAVPDVLQDRRKRRDTCGTTVNDHGDYCQAAVTYRYQHR